MIMYRPVPFLSCFLLLASAVYGDNVTTIHDDMETLKNLTGNNELWMILLKDCQEPSLHCVQNNVFSYLRKTLDETDDLQFTSFLKFKKNRLKYDSIKDRSFNDTSDDLYEEFPIESMAKSLQDNTAKFFMTHDLEISLPDGLVPNSVLKVAPRGYQDTGTLVNLEIVSKDLEEARALEPEGGRTFKKIRKFITERVIYAILALLLVLKLLAFKFLFLLPLIVGAATAKKLLLKILLFIFPFLHHIFKFCAYYPIQAKYHHHKHLINHIHQVAPHHDHHHEGIEVAGPPGYGPPNHETHFDEFEDDVGVVPDDGPGFHHGFISHRKDPLHANTVHESHHRPHQRRKPLTSTEIERIAAKAEQEAFIKARLEKERLRIREENLKLQEQLNQAIKLQEKLKIQAQHFGPNKFSPSYPVHKPAVHPPPLKGSHFVAEPGIELPAGYIPQHTVPQRPQVYSPPQPSVFESFPPVVAHNNFEQQYQASQAAPVTSSPVYRPSVEVQKSVEFDPRIATSKEVEVTKKVTEKTIGTPKPKLEHKEIYKAASITFDPFYSPILDKIDRILQGLGFKDEPCKERLVCSMYKNPTVFSPHSNLLSAELSRDSSELQKPASTNSAVIRFYKYVQAARDGQDQRDCLRLYTGCAINTEVS